MNVSWVEATGGPMHAFDPLRMIDIAIWIGSR
jgi:hypothetical protein